LGITVLFSAFFSGVETAFISANQVKIEIWVRQKIRGADLALRFLKSPDHFLITTLIGNNISMVVASSMMVLYMEKFIPLTVVSYWRGFIITGLSSFLLLTFGEILPKSYCSDHASRVSIHAAFLLRMIYYLLFPFIKLVRIATSWIMNIFNVDLEQSRQVFSRKDMERLVREGSKSGIVEADQQDLISRFLLRGDFKLRDVMIPRTEIVAVMLSDSISHVKKIFQNTGFSRLPVMRLGVDDIVGAITAKDIILKKPKRIGQILREVHFVPETRKMSSFLHEMQEKSPDLAIVVDEYGGTSGLVTLEDMVEEFFGDIQDEYDGNENLYRKETQHQIDVRGRAEIHELNARHHLHIPEGEYNTLAGFLMEAIGHIPRRGEKFEFSQCSMTILSATRRKVNWVRIHKKQIQ
jgi:putative hemolysin